MFYRLAVVIFLLNVVGEKVVYGRNYLSANSLSITDNVTARASVKISMSGGRLCSGTLISSNIVYTAAHCLQGYQASSVGVYHFSAPQERYQAKTLYVPKQYATGEKMGKAVSAKGVRAVCDSGLCSSDCVTNAFKMAHYYSHFDYALILLEKPLPICEQANPASPVAATIANPSPKSDNGEAYVPADDKAECFVAGYGTTDERHGGIINLAIVNRLDGYSNTDCDVIKQKGVFTRFHNSSATNKYETSICAGDFGSGIQCISDGGKSIRVVGVNTESWSRQGWTSDDSIQRCRDPHDSFTLSVQDHAEDMFNVIKEWMELETLVLSKYKCEKFLENHPYNSVMFHYLDRTPEFGDC